MKNFKRISAAVLLIFSIIVTALPFGGHVDAATLVYSKESNSGARDVVCVTLEGTGASKYYTGNYTYDKLDDLSGDALFDALQTLMRDTHTKITSYDDCRDYAFKTDCQSNDTEYGTTLYTSFQMTWDGHWKGGNWKCNREHVWPKSLGGNSTKGGGSDLHHIRPAEANVNTSRNNKLYGTGGSGSVKGTHSGVIGGTYTNVYFEPNDNVKGDVARICLYMYVRWNSDWGCDRLEKVFESVEILLEWCELDPVDTWEMGRNEVIGEIQGNRNVFIDYPELAWLMLGYDIPEGMTTPSGEASSGDPDCAHTSTEVKNASSANCGTDGYTGDTHCKDCGMKISSGTVIKANGSHKFGDWSLSNGKETRTCSVCKTVDTRDCSHKNTVIKNSTPATCGASGYSGDTYCNDCNKTIKTGSAVSATGKHEFGAWETSGNKQIRSCLNCTKQEERATPQCKHASTELRNAVDPTCGVSGYTGDTYCKDCGSIVTEGVIIAPIGNHENTVVKNASNPICGAQGYSGDTYCNDCNQKISDGTAIPATGEHKNTVIKNEKSASCSEDGYTGDTYCNDCETVTAQGQTIPATGEHFIIKGEIITKPTKKEDGLRIDKCANCDYVECIVLPATGTNDNTVIIVIIVASVILIGAAVAVTVIVIKKKKN